MKMACGGVSAETLYDVLHDGSYRRKWDSNMMDAYDIGRLTANADVGYYSCEPLSNAGLVFMLLFPARPAAKAQQKPKQLPCSRRHSRRRRRHRPPGRATTWFLVSRSKRVAP